MPRVSDVFQGSFLKADVDVPDLEDGGIVFTIKDGEVKDFDDGAKIILHFEETDKGLVLNKTNANTLIDLFKSDDTDDWIGRKVKLYAKDVEYQGKMTRGIRISTREVKSTKANPANAAKATPVAAGGRDFDETAPPPRPAASQDNDPDSPDGPPF